MDMILLMGLLLVTVVGFLIGAVVGFVLGHDIADTRHEHDSALNVDWVGFPEWREDLDDPEGDEKHGTPRSV